MWRILSSASHDLHRLPAPPFQRSIVGARSAVAIPGHCRRSYTWGVQSDGESTVPLWTPAVAAAASTPTTVTSMLCSFTHKMLAAKRSPTQPRYRAAVLLHADASLMPTEWQDLRQATQSLAHLLHLPFYALSAEEPIARVSNASLISTPPNGAGATLRDAAASPHWPEFLIVVSHDEVSARQLIRSANAINPTLHLAGGKVQTDLRRFKRAGTHGFDAQSPIVRACIEGIRPPDAAPTPLRVLDVTMGLGADSALLASFHTLNRGGLSVSMLEQDAVMSLLMLDALTRLHNQVLQAETMAAGSPLPEWVGVSRALLSRLSLRFGSAESFFKETWPRLPEDQRPECIYADPFYPDPEPSEISTVPRHQQKAASKSKKEMELARMLWEQTRTQYPHGADEGAIAAAATKAANSSAAFFASPTNTAIQSLLESAFAVASAPAAAPSSSPGPTSPRIVLKHPSDPFARRLLSSMGFECARTFQSRDTCFYVMAKRPEGVAAFEEPVLKPTNARPSSAKEAGGVGGGGGKKKSKKPGTRGSRFFHSVAARCFSTLHRSPPSLPSPPVCDAYTFRPLGVLRSCFPDRFSIPRQGCLAPSATAVLTLEPEAMARFTQSAAVGSAAESASSADWSRSVSGLEDFSHLWLVWVCHDNIKHAPTAASQSDDASMSTASAVNIGWRSTARPPRLGGKEEVGVFASRSPYRPNAIGMSLVQLERVVFEPSTTSPSARRVHLHLRGVDVLDGTPILDIKPFVSYCDSPAAASDAAAAPASSPLPSVRLGWATDPVRRFEVRVTPEVRARIAQAQLEIDVHVASDPALPRASLIELLCDLLSLDARHGHQQSAHPALSSAAAPAASSSAAAVPAPAPTSASVVGRRYGLRVLDYNFDYRVHPAGGFEVDHMETIEDYQAHKEQRRAARQQAAEAAATGAAQVTR